MFVAPQRAARCLGDGFGGFDLRLDVALKIIASRIECLLRQPKDHLAEHNPARGSRTQNSQAAASLALVWLAILVYYPVG